MHIAQRVAKLQDDTETYAVVEYGVAYWNGEETLVDVFQTQEGRDESLADYALNHGEDNVAPIDRTVTVTPASAWRIPEEEAREDCDLCLAPQAATGEYVGPEDADRPMYVCRDCLAKPQHRDLILAV